jgi:hypothetical protein
MKFQCSLIARAAMTALFIGASAHATVINEYTDVVSWNSATTGGITNQMFTGANQSSSTNAGLTYGSVNYVGFYNESTGPTNSGYFTFRWQSPSPGYDTGTGDYLIGGSSGGTGDGTNGTGIRADLLSLSNITALSFNFSGYRNNTSGTTLYSTTPSPITLDFALFESNVLTYTKTLTIPPGTLGLGFFGITTTGNITGIRLNILSPTNSEQNRIILDNFAYAQAAETQGSSGGGGEVPEPESYLLCAAGLLGAFFLRRKSS